MFKKSFTLIELLVVIAIIGMLSSIVLVSMSSVRGKARDARRMSDLRQIATALEIFYDMYNRYPNNTDSGDVGCWGSWDAGNSQLNGESDPFIKELEDTGLIKVPRETVTTGSSPTQQCSYRYAKVANPCDCVGTYAILYAFCETPSCPTNEKPSCLNCWGEGSPPVDAYDIGIYLKE